ncbi:MAG: protein-methionine-sulfoxide reductase catalytic subunit MsrP [Rhodospirillaceae bacterium]|jgi:sulfoxide reductase catalytic subunit YedY|nr:protein-methionine-sulfoxide reductase catalytic subunit MsrP [Rhodospirillaceae bacterium]MBT5241537.1 protein-methionine-sulfoxide reductase catalytic subunit MsrP [Rhodospirillaceae bacterium]MBT5566193.1 protein-methionine-sulfoxide reductase catalytic subunit MsrP [Rhodospirillaceae bacterium]MBT6088911.1 protein-methionine-sulfoxide reductase catalytic subunit MsrP [Rhodospirillaceae bacterium]MBT6960102.1 protein-methionine-sulfoxide reductase catalytic subunit MsrP [Rhodospirillaceae
MLIRMARKSTPKSSEITPKDVYLNRRRFIAGTGLIAGSAALGLNSAPVSAAVEPPGANPALSPIVDGYSKVGADDPLTPYTDVTSYNNFYEFGTGKGDPVENAGPFNPKPWEITVDGMCANPGTMGLEDFLKPHDLEERIYRLRCVEAWSMVVPWVGISLADVVKRFEPNGSAKYVQFETIVRKEEMVGQRSRRILPWPYIEGLRLDEAMNPLAILAVGLYGEELPNQNGAPIRLMTPWKYGFKSIKSIVKITFTDKKPKNTWQVMASNEYGFYANVNPGVDHPRWSQARERRIGDFLRRETLMFNGYEEEVGELYAGMNLRKEY